MGGEICPVGTPDLSHDRAMRVRPVGTVELLPHGGGIAIDTRGRPHSIVPTGRRARDIASLRSRRPYGTIAFRTRGRSAETSAKRVGRLRLRRELSRTITATVASPSRAVRPDRAFHLVARSVYGRAALVARTLCGHQRRRRPKAIRLRGQARQGLPPRSPIRSRSGGVGCAYAVPLFDKQLRYTKILIDLVRFYHARRGRDNGSTRALADFE